MRILITNDDGVRSPGLWALVRELSNFAEVVVSAPDREQSAVGTAVTLRSPLRAHKVDPAIAGIVAYAVEGTPGDSVILALEKLVNKVDLVVSGINNGLNMGDDVLISGTVGAALQGYLRGLPSIAISMAEVRSPYMENAARVVGFLARRIEQNHIPRNLFLNVNVPTLPLSEISAVKVTRLAPNSHIDTVDEGHDGKREYYWLLRRKTDHNHDDRTDIGALASGLISVTALSPSLLGKPGFSTIEGLCTGLLEEVRVRPGPISGIPCAIPGAARAELTNIAPIPDKPLTTREKPL